MTLKFQIKFELIDTEGKPIDPRYKADLEERVMDFLCDCDEATEAVENALDGDEMELCYFTASGSGEGENSRRNFDDE